MIKQLTFIPLTILSFVAIIFSSCNSNAQTAKSVNPYYSKTDTTKLNVSNKDWKKVLSPDLYEVARNGATETAFTGTYNEFDALGSYNCAACGNALFLSDAKFASTCGWPSFYEPIYKNSVRYKEDKSYGMTRTEVLCGRCDGHLGHIFDDGPKPTGKRFCMNSISLEFTPNKK
jgi:peptide-methionine (R)-S-oxide reductase